MASIKLVKALINTITKEKGKVQRVLLHVYKLCLRHKSHLFKKKLLLTCLRNNVHRLSFQRHYTSASVVIVLSVQI